MLQNTNAATTAPGLVSRAPAAAAERRMRNIRAFEAGLGSLKAAFPGLRHERTGSQIEWFVRSSRPLAAPGLALSGSLVLDIPCSEDTAEILDAMAYANDPTLDRAGLDRELADEMAYLATRLDHALDYLHRLARRDIDAGGLRTADYLRAVSAELGAKAVDLYPAWSQQEGKHYRPSQHIRDRVKAACAAALRKARGSAAPAPARAKDERKPERKAGRGPDRRPSRAEPARRTPRPFRMRRYSALYE